jgi:hypothetical protein
LAGWLLGIGWALATQAQPVPSVLAEGSWLKIGITKTGIYKLDAAFLTKSGVPVASVDPRTIRLFGNGGATLPQANNKARPRDLTENAIWITGETDGRFDGSDAVYFFAESPHPRFLRFDHLATLAPDQSLHRYDVLFSNVRPENRQNASPPSLRCRKPVR